MKEEETSKNLNIKKISTFYVTGNFYLLFKNKNVKANSLTSHKYNKRLQ